MFVITAQNVHDALPQGLDLLKRHGKKRPSRNGDVLVMDGPVTTVYTKPEQRVIFWPERDANPFFHLMESLWMLAGRNDVEFCAKYVERMRSFSDDGLTFHGAYGHRWRVHFGFDQLGHIIQALRDNKEDRRQVLQMWDANVDLGRLGKDLPCNTQAYFSVNVNGELDMTVCNRSNDIIWGAYGANAVHFSFLQEYVARGIGVPVGRYWQISNNYHAYLNTFEPLEHLADQAPDPHRVEPRNPYDQYDLEPFPLMSTPIAEWQEELRIFLEDGWIMGMKEPFFRKVAWPMMRAHQAFKEKKGLERYSVSMHLLTDCEDAAWRIAATEWVQRRKEKFQKAQDDGVGYE